MMAAHMLSTVDNPYNPFTHWDEWWAYDTEAGHHTSGLLARVAKNSEELSESDQERVNELAIEEILKEDIFGIFIKVSPDSVIVPTKIQI
jgi:hypothetical protein